MSSLDNSYERITEPYPGDVSQTKVLYPFLPRPWQHVVTLSQNEIATLAGDRFFGEASVVLGLDEKQYMQITMPDNPGNQTDVVIFFTFRDIQVDDGIYFRVRWDPVGVVKGASAIIHSENQLLLKSNQLEWTLVTGTPSELGNIIETIKIRPSSGQGAGIVPPGAIGGTAGYRIYDPNRQVLLEIENRGVADNEVIIQYNWVEVPRALLNY